MIIEFGSFQLKMGLIELIVIGFGAIPLLYISGMILEMVLKSGC